MSVTIHQTAKLLTAYRFQLAADKMGKLIVALRSGVG
jgi:hypothetical protein